MVRFSPSLLFLLLGAVNSLTYDGVALFYHPSDVTGNITFKKQASNTEIYVNMNIPAGTADYDVKIYQYMADYGKKDPCATSLIGGVWDPTSKSNTANCGSATPANCIQGDLTSMYGNLAAMNKGATAVTTSYGPGSSAEVVGRTVVLLQGGEIKSCAPIIFEAARTFYRSKITEKYNVNGEVNLQRSGNTIITNSRLLRDDKYIINQLRITDQARTIQGSCAAYSSSADLNNWGNSAWTSKQDVTVTTGWSASRSNPTNLVVRQGHTTPGWVFNNRICAPIYKIAAKAATATFDQNGVSGTIKFTQESPYHPVVVKRSFAFKNDNIASARISEYSVPLYSDAIMTMNDICESVPGTPFATAALQGTEFSCRGITLYGVNSIIGRAIVLKTTNTTFCANIRNDNSVKRLVADFHGKLGGEITLEQDASDPNADTTIYNSLYACKPAFGNKVRMILNDNLALESKTMAARCAATSVFYPDFANTNSDLDSNAACSNPDFAYNCKQGVTYSRIGNLEIQNVTSTVRWVKVMTDPYMALSSSYEIPTGIKLTYVKVADSGDTTENLDCANLKEIPNIQAQAVVASQSNSVYKADVKIAFVQYKQKNADNIAIEMEFQDVLALTKSLSVRENPVPVSRSGFPYLTCSEDLLGKVSNTNKGKVKKMMGSNFNYASGSISSKYSVFSNANARNVTKNVMSDNYNFYDKKETPLYRSIRMGYGEDDEDYLCANINPVTSTSGFVENKLYAVFYGWESQVSGQITMKQLTYKDSYSGSSSGTYYFPTNIQTYLTHSNHSNWITDTHRIYITKFSSCAAIIDNKVNLTTDLFNPYAIGTNYVHNEQYPHFSQVGDVSAKSGMYTSLGKRTFMNLDNLPLTGDFSAKGKAVIVSSSLNEAYLGCTLLQPDLVNGSATAIASLIALLLSATLTLF